MFTSLFRNLLSGAASRKTPFRKTERKPACRLNVEILEDRAVPAGFNFADFSDVSNLSLLGRAAVTPSNVLRLTPASAGPSGAAWYTADKQFVGLAFETTFQFQMTENFDSPGGSDGFVFIIQNTAPTFLAGGGGTLGYNGLMNSLAVEFDTFQNSEANDPSPSHISVHTNGTGPNSWMESLSLGSYNTNPIMDDTNVHTAKIAYTPGTLAVYLDDLTTPKLTVAVDLAEKLNLDAGRAWVGFTAATGGGWQNHDILNWNYTTVPANVNTTISVNDVTATEGNSGTQSYTFTITRAGDTTGTTTANWTTENRTATAGSDYTGASGQVVFGPGDTQQTITVDVNGETTLESDETFVVRLSGSGGGSIADGVGIGTILTDDVAVSVTDASTVEGNSPHYRGAFVQGLPGTNFNDLTFGPGPEPGVVYLYAAPGPGAGGINRYDSTTGAFIEQFAPSGLPNPLRGVRDIVFRAGYMYVASENTDEVLRYDVSTKAFVDAFVAAGSIDGPHGMAFGPDTTGDTIPELYVTGRNSFTVVRYDGATGAPLGALNTSGSGALNLPEGITIEPNGIAYVASTGSNQIQKYNAATGAYLGAITSSQLSGPKAVRFGPSDGLMYVASSGNNRILRFNTNGAYVDDYVPAGSGGLVSPYRMEFGPDGDLYVTALGTMNQIFHFGTEPEASFTVSLSSASSVSVSVNFATANGSASAGSDYTTTNGTLTFAPGVTSMILRVPTLDDAVNEPTETFTVNLSNATIADGQGVASILDNDTPLMTINDVSVTEGNSGTKVITFTVTLSNASYQTVTVNYATANGTANQGEDYTAASGTLTFASGQTTKTITIVVKGDKKKEANETFFVNLSGASNAVLTDSQGLGTILNDD